MKLEDLTGDEQTALARLIRLVARIDNSVSGGERAQIDEIAADLGEELFWKLIDASKSSTWKFDRCLEVVERQEVRELIYGALLGIALVGTLERAEREALERVAATWGIEEVVEAPHEGAAADDASDED